MRLIREVKFGDNHLILRTKLLVPLLFPILVPLILLRLLSVFVCNNFPALQLIEKTNLLKDQSVWSCIFITHGDPTQITFTCSKSTIETLEKV